MTTHTRLLITGERRSGTTLVANLLNAAPRMTVYRDFLHIGRLLRIAGVDSLVAPLAPEQKDAIIRHFEAADTTRRAARVVGLARDQFDTLIDFYTVILDRVAHPGDLVAGHKTTSAHGVVGTLLREVPRLKVVYMLRDPRDVTLSAVKRFPHQSWSVHVANWRDSYETMVPLFANGSISSCIHVMRFDNLLLDRDGVFASLAHFLGVDEIRVPDAMTDYGQAWQDNSSFGDITSGGAHRNLDPTPVGRWRARDPALGRRVELLLHDLMAEAGFALSAPVDEDERRRALRGYRLDRLMQAPRTLIHRARRKLGGAP